MNNREIYNLAKENYDKLTFSYNYQDGLNKTYEIEPYTFVRKYYENR